MTVAVSTRQVCVVGLGCIGLPTARVLAGAGDRVHGVDAKPSVAATVNCGGVHIVEPRLDEVNLDGSEKHILDPAPSYDVIIDDSSHRSSNIIKSFARDFPRLADGALFVVEDIHSSYRQESEGELFTSYSSIDLFKSLADIVSHDH